MYMRRRCQNAEYVEFKMEEWHKKFQNVPSWLREDMQNFIAFSNSNRYDKWLKEKQMECSEELLQKVCLLERVKIIKKVLCI